MSPVLSSFTIPRHCVVSLEGGLSSLQQALLVHPSPVRIGIAPTGGGKTYAFTRAALEGKRILFIPPTRRLVQNVARSLIESFMHGGLPEAEAAARVAIWSSDERARLREADPSIRVGAHRVRQMRGYHLPSPGDMVIATPESVAHLLVRPSGIDLSENPPGIWDLVREFDHVVFDEFHTIGPRAFGLPSAVCAVASQVGGGAKVTFLSATPLDILPVLARNGVAGDAVALLNEEVVTGRVEETADARALHGDMRVEFIGDRLLDTVRARGDKISACVRGGRQVVIVYDSVHQLLKDRVALAEFLDGLGIGPDRRMAISSTDDARRSDETDRFASGWNRDPMDFDVIVATSSVEMGVTFRAGLMFTDGGHSALSLMQRIGRPARGDEPGTVVVAVPEAKQARSPWLRTMMSETARCGGVVRIERLTEIAMRSQGSGTFASPGSVPTAYGTLGYAAVGCSALFWVAMERSWPQRKGQRQTLRSFSTPRIRFVSKLLRTIRATGLPTAKRWADAFEAEALRFREFGQRVLVAEVETRKVWNVPWTTYAAYPELLLAPSTLDEASGMLVVHPSRRLEQILKGEAVPVGRPRVSLPSPETSVARSYDADHALDAWLSRARKLLHSNDLDPDQSTALRAAVVLVRMCRILPSNLEDTSTGAG